MTNSNKTYGIYTNSTASVTTLKNPIYGVPTANRTKGTMVDLDRWYNDQIKIDVNKGDVGDLRVWYNVKDQTYKCQYYSGTQWLDVHTTT